MAFYSLPCLDVSADKNRNMEGMGFSDTSPLHEREDSVIEANG